MYIDHSIAVVVTVYNEELLIGNTLSSILSFVNCLYPVNDDSNDKTREPLDEIPRKDPGVILIRHEINFGLYARHCEGCSSL